MNNYRVVSSCEYNNNPARTARKVFSFEFDDNEVIFVNTPPVKKTPCGCTKAPAKKAELRNKVDGNFLVRVTDDPNFPELAQRLVDYASKLDLSINPNVKKLRSGQSLAFGAPRMDYDVNTVVGGLEGGIIDFTNGAWPIYFIDRDFETIVKAIRNLAEEKRLLLLERGMEIATGKRSFKPTYYELKSQKVGEKLVAEKRDEHIHKLMTKQIKEEKQVKASWLDRVLISTNFIKVGYDFIPINDNDTVVLSV